MKLRNIFTALAIAALTFVGCQERERFLDEVKVSKSMVALDVDGGSAEITVSATAAWKFAEIKDVWPVEIERDKDGNITDETPSWLSVSVVSGVAGDTKVVFSAEATTETRQLTLNLECAGAAQQVTVLQMAEKVDLPITSCQDFNEKGEDGKTYRVSGTVTSIANTTYGNFYINDGTGEAYIYGTLYDGAEQQFSKHGIGVGDLVVVEGPRKTYNGTIELVNVTVISIEKSLVLVDPKEVVIEKEAGEFEIGVDNKGFCTVDVDVDWIQFAGMSTSAAKFTYEAYEVMGAPRTGTVTFTVKKGDRESVVPVTVTQYGITPDPVAIADAVKEDKGTWLSVEGIVTGIHGDGLMVTDAAGNSLYGYVKATPEAKIGDAVIMTGKLSNYRQFYQLETPVVRISKSGEKFNYPTPVELTEEVFAQWGENIQTAQYITATGVADGSNYGAVTVAGHTISPYKISSSFKYDKLYGKNVTIKGYALQYQGSKSDLRILVTSVEEVVAEDAE